MYAPGVRLAPDTPRSTSQASPRLRRSEPGSPGGFPAEVSREPCGLYLHVPFCASICPYCDFAVSRGGRSARARFTAALVSEIAASASTVRDGARFDTLYLGGGTPSALEPEQLEAILTAARAALPLDSRTFVVLEANPEDVAPAAVEAWRGLGVRGVSLGVQSFDDGVLRFLGRRHDGAEAGRAVELALAAGFDWVSLDLIYGSPGEGLVRDRGRHRDVRSEKGAATSRDPVALALGDVEVAAGLGPHHISCYQLTVHEGTMFGRARDRGRLREIGCDAQATLFLALHQALSTRGYAAYEVSSFAREPRHRSRHNSKYWRHVPYLGLGPSAHSFDGRSRWWNVGEWRRWAGAVEGGTSPVGGAETLGVEELALETVLLGLRTVDGIDLEAYRERYGVDLVEINRRAVEQAVASGLLLAKPGGLRPTTRGLAVADALSASLDLGLAMSG